MREYYDSIFEAIIVNISYSSGTCTISPLDVNRGSDIDNIIIPQTVSSGNAGIFVSVNIGTRVVAAKTSGTGRVVFAIISILPDTERMFGNFSSFNDTPSDLRAYPEMADGRVVICGGYDNKISLMETGDLTLTMTGGAGLYMRENDGDVASTFITHDNSVYTDGSRLQNGAIRRIKDKMRRTFLKESVLSVPLHADTKYELMTDKIGFFPGSPVLNSSYSTRKRNPGISEYKLIINEFCSDSQFTGFDDEAKRVTGDISLFDNRDTFARNRDQGNSLHLAEHELVEIIGGNVVDISGSILDINYRPLKYGATGNKVPTSNIEKIMDKSRRLSRRGIGYHFQLTTNTRSSDKGNSDGNFVYDIDKEGMIKIHIPKSSNSGNIGYRSDALFAGKNTNSINVSITNPAKKEPIPVMLRDANGEIVFPGAGSQGVSERLTGVRYSNSQSSPYFPSQGASGFANINTTSYHNMTACCERIIACRVEHVNLPQPPVDGVIRGLPFGKPFEVPMPKGFLNSSNQGVDSPFPSFMSVVAVSPGQPAIYTGGDSLMCGVFYPDDLPSLSNSFSSSKNNSGFDIRTEDSYGKPAIPTGGRSANIALDGSMELSVGKDNSDGKSIVLDTDGSLIAWLGSDHNNRSAAIQTDGEFLLNIGGTYPDKKKMTVGRFELRVNVTDKGFVSEIYDGSSDGTATSESDYIISISENGLVIAGTKAGTPMIIRNEGSIMIESGAGDVILSGTQVKTIESKGSSKTAKVSGR